MNLSPSPSSFPIEDHDNQQHDPHPFASNNRVFSLSSSLPSYHIFFTSTQDDAGFCHGQFHEPRYDEDDGHGGSSSYEIKNKVNSSGLKLTLWKKEDQAEDVDNYPVKPMGLMKKMITKRPRPKLWMQPTSSFETDLSSNSYSYNSSNSPIRVCSDCNTTKTPLWRSGPKGPKSLCNACGIRQRKARRAMEAAAAAASGGSATVAASDHRLPAMKMIKVHHREKIGKNRHSPQLKKRCKMGAAGDGGHGGGSGGGSSMSIEDFLMKLSNNLAFKRVFPQDERDAAILLMALSSGLVHG